MKITLKAARTNKGLNQQEAADALGISRTTLQSWETCKSFPTVNQVPMIESLYGVKYEEIIFLPDNSTLSINTAST